MTEKVNCLTSDIFRKINKVTQPGRHCKETMGQKVVLEKSTCKMMRNNITDYGDSISDVYTVLITRFFGIG